MHKTPFLGVQLSVSPFYGFYVKNPENNRDWLKSYLPIFLPSSTPSILINSSSIGIPLSNLGFPWSDNFAGGYENLFYMGNYISSDFILEDVSFECVLSSRCEAFNSDFSLNRNHPYFDTNENIPLSNLLNFFILNQRSNNINKTRQAIHPSTLSAATYDQPMAFDMVGYAEDEFPDPSKFHLFPAAAIKNTYSASLDRIKGLPYGTSNLASLLPTDDSLQDTDSSGYFDRFKSIFIVPKDNNKYFFFLFEEKYKTDPFPSFDVDEGILPTSRELVTYHNLVLYNNYCGSNSNIDWESSTQESDLVYQVNTGNQKLDAHITFTSSSFVLSGSCVKTLKYKNASAFSYFRDRAISNDNENNSDEVNSATLNNKVMFFLSNNHGERDFLGNKSSREITSHNDSATISREDAYSHGSQVVRHNQIKNIKEVSPYILSPNDTLIFGVNSFSNIDEFPALLKLHDKVRVRLKGRYASVDRDNITSSNKRGMTSNNVKSVIIGNTYVSDRYDTEPIYALSGSYIDNIPNGKVGNTLDGDLSTGKNGSFYRAIAINDFKNTIYDSMLPNILDIMKANGKNLYVSAQLGATDGQISKQILVGDIPTNLDEWYNNFLQVLVDAGEIDQATANASQISNLSFVRPGFEEEFNNNFTMKEWKYQFPFEEKFKNLHRFTSIDIHRSANNIKWTEPSVNLGEDPPEPPGLSLDGWLPKTSANIIGIDFDLYMQLGNDSNAEQYSIAEESNSYESDPFKKYLNLSRLFYGITKYDKRVSNILGIYNKIPIYGFKYGVYNTTPMYLKSFYNWKSYGQFADRYNSSTNTAFLKENGQVSYPIRKTFVDQYENSIEIDKNTEQPVNDLVDTYNQNIYSKVARPYFD